jgi:molybdopterin-guanine dinucleotide biosynthesis protein A
MIDAGEVTGLVLAGGRGSRMGGVDKGLQGYRGVPLALHALRRLEAQVGSVMISANRNRDAYASFGVPVWPDALPDFAGPLSGFLAGLERCPTSWMVTVPCDTPAFPTDLVRRLADAAGPSGAEIAMPTVREADGRWRTQPVFCLLQTALLVSLVRFTQAGGRKIDAWTAQHRTVEVPFDDAAAFVNANTPAELQQLESP